MNMIHVTVICMISNLFFFPPARCEGVKGWSVSIGYLKGSETRYMDGVNSHYMS